MAEPNVGVTPVTAVPVCPLILLMTFVVFALTSVTHVAAEAEDNKTPFKLPKPTIGRKLSATGDVRTENTPIAEMARRDLRFKRAPAAKG